MRHHLCPSAPRGGLSRNWEIYASKYLKLLSHYNMLTTVVFHRFRWLHRKWRNFEFRNTSGGTAWVFTGKDHWDKERFRWCGDFFPGMCTRERSFQLVANINLVWWYEFIWGKYKTRWQWLSIKLEVVVTHVPTRPFTDRHIYSYVSRTKPNRYVSIGAGC